MSSPDGESAGLGVAARSETFRALREPSFALFWGGAFISNVGTWFHTVAQGWLVLQLTGSASWLGLVAFLSYLPALLFMPLGGVLADRTNRRRLLLSMQVLMLLSAAAKGLLVQLHLIQAWHVAALAALTGTALAFNGPSFSAMIKDLTGPDDLPSGVALIGTQFHLSRALGPFLAAALLDHVGIAGAFYLNAASFLAVIAALVLMRPRYSAAQKADATPWIRSFVDGLTYVRDEKLTRWMMLLAGALALMAMPHVTLLPLLAKHVFRVGAEGLGYLTGATGAGAVVGALSATWLAARFGRVRTTLAASLITALALCGLGLTRSFPVAIVMLTVSGATGVVTATVGLTTVQATVPDHFRGRVMSLQNLAFMGGLTIGSLIAGAVAERLGGGPTISLGAVAFMGALVGLLIGRPRDPADATSSAR